MIVGATLLNALGAFVPSWRTLSGQAGRWETALETGRSNGDPISPIVDRSGGGTEFSQATGATKATYAATGILGKPAYAFSGSQYESAAIILHGITALTVVWIGTFTSVAGMRAAFSFGVGNGIGFTVGESGSAVREIYLGGSTVVTADSATTNPELWIATYDGGANPKSKLRVNGVAKTLANDTGAMIDPATGSSLGGLVGGLHAMAGYQALLVAFSRVLSAGEIAQIEADAQLAFPGIF